MDTHVPWGKAPPAEEFFAVIAESKHDVETLVGEVIRESAKASQGEISHRFSIFPAGDFQLVTTASIDSIVELIRFAELRELTLSGHNVDFSEDDEEETLHTVKTVVGYLLSPDGIDEGGGYSKADIEKMPVVFHTEYEEDLEIVSTYITPDGIINVDLVPIDKEDEGNDDGEPSEGGACGSSPELQLVCGKYPVPAAAVAS